jgi:transposase
MVPPTGVRVLVATKPVDFRKGMDGLAAYLQHELQADPFSGVVYVFRAKRADKAKLLFWDQTGLGLIDIHDSRRESVLIHCASDQLIRSAAHGEAVRAQ